MRIDVHRLLTAFFLVAPLVAQTPQVTAIVSAADSQPRVAIGGLGTIYGASLASGSFSAAATPWPARLGDTEVLICDSPILLESCVTAGLTYAGPTQINFHVPVTISTTATQRVVIRRGGAPNTSSGAEAQAFSFRFDEAAPRVFFMGYDCFIDTRYPEANRNCGVSFTRPPAFASARGAVTDLQGRVVSSSNPARAGQFYTIWTTGLGRFLNGAPYANLRLTLTNAPLNRTTGIQTASHAITPSFIGPSAQFPGLYQINFFLPVRTVDGTGATVDGRGGTEPPFPCGDYSWELQLEIQQTDGTAGVTAAANYVSLPIAVKSGDVPNCGR